MKTILQNIFKEFPHDTNVLDLPEVVAFDEVWVPFQSWRCSPELAELRRQNDWAEKDCVPCLTVEYRRKDSTAVSALGRL